MRPTACAILPAGPTSWSRNIRARERSIIRTALTPNLELIASTDIFFTDKYFASQTLDPRVVQKAYAKVNARIALAGPGRWELAVLGKNLTNRKPLTFGDVSPLAYSVFGAYNNFELFGEGRTVVLQGRIEF